jgi:hypothetical protein
MDEVRYLFIWDHRERTVVASYYVDRGSGEGEPPGDTTHGGIAVDEEETLLAELRTRYPSGRYTFGGGYAPSLAACVEGFFGLEKDYRHFFEEPMAREEAAEVATRHVNDRYDDPDDHLVVLDTPVMRKPYGWVFFYQSRRYLDTGDFRHQLVGNGPVVVCDDGTVHPLGSALGPEGEIRDFEFRRGFLGDT